jgi:hypothetical protein
VIEKLKGELVLSHVKEHGLLVSHSAMLDDAKDRGFEEVLFHGETFSGDVLIFIGNSYGEPVSLDAQLASNHNLSGVAIYLQKGDEVYFIGPFDDDAEAIDGGEA